LGILAAGGALSLVLRYRPGVNNTIGLQMTEDEEIAALDSAIVQIEQAMQDASLAKAKREDFEKVLETLRAMRAEILDRSKKL
jgi:hypothetical protein